MPFIQKTYNHTADSYTLLDTPSVLNYPEYAIEDNTGTLKSITSKKNLVARYSSNEGWDKRGTYIYVHVEGTSIFYQDLKQILSSLDDNILSITHDDSNFSFTIFDTTFYMRALNLYDYVATNATTNIQAGLSVPVIYRKGKQVVTGWSCNRNLNMYERLVGNHSGYSGEFNNNLYKIYNMQSFSTGAYSSITTQNKQQFIYTIKIRYNTNFLHISYENWNGNEIPLLFVMQGQDINQKDVVFTTLGGAVNSRWYNFNNITLDAITHVVQTNQDNYFGEPSNVANPAQWPDCRPFARRGHYIQPLYDLFYPGGKDISGTTNINPYCFFTNLYATTKPYCFGLYSLSRSDNTLLTKPICVNGFIDFDNIYYAPSGLQKWNANYEINGEQYWCMGSYMRDTIANWRNLGYNTQFYTMYYDFSFLLKL